MYLTSTLGKVRNQLELYSSIIFFLNLAVLLFEEMLLRVLIFTSEQTVHIKVPESTVKSSFNVV